MKNLLAILGAFAFFPLLILYSSFSWGYVATVFHDWFIIPIWPDFKNLSWKQYAGIMFFIGCFIRPSNVSIKDEFKDNTALYFASFLGPWIALLCGWVFTLFI